MLWCIPSYAKPSQFSKKKNLWAFNIIIKAYSEDSTEEKISLQWIEVAEEMSKKNQIGGEHTDAVVNILMTRIVPFMNK